MIILDTNAVSEPLKPAPNVGYLQWFGAQASETLFITAITVAEMLTGIEKMPKGKRREAIYLAMTEHVFPLFQGRILGFDGDTAPAFATVVTGANRAGNDIAFADAAIAAIAIIHAYPIVTRNVRDYKGTGVEVIDPWVG
jgi:toxin FitB